MTDKNEKLEIIVGCAMSNLDRKITEILLTELSETRAQWLMMDISHLLYGHTQNDIINQILDSDD